MRLRTYTRVTVLGAIMALSACSGDMGELRQYVEQIKARPGGRIEPLPQIDPPPTFAYEAMTLRPPFTPYRPGGDAQGVRPDDGRPKEFLERYPLDTLRMVGSIGSEGRLYALVQDPDGLIHRVQPGQHMGQNYGRIEEISDAEINLIEIVPDGVGGYVERAAGLALSE